MLRVTLRDLQWRRRRFVIAIIGTSLVFAMTLVLTGLSNGFRVEANNTVDALGVDAYLVRSGPAGDYFGEIGTLFGLPRSATVRARTDAVVIGYTGQAFRQRLGPAGVRDLIEHRELTIN